MQEEKQHECSCFCTIYLSFDSWSSKLISIQFYCFIMRSVWQTVKKTEHYHSTELATTASAAARSGKAPSYCFEYCNITSKAATWYKCIASCVLVVTCVADLMNKGKPQFVLINNKVDEEASSYRFVEFIACSMFINYY